MDDRLRLLADHRAAGGVADRDLEAGRENVVVLAESLLVTALSVTLDEPCELDEITAPVTSPPTIVVSSPAPPLMVVTTSIGVDST